MEQEKLKNLLGDDYKENISDDEAIELLVRLRTDEKEKHAKDKMAFDKTSTELATLKKKASEKLTEEEKQKEQFDQVKAENEALKKERDISNLTAKYIGLGYDPKLAKETAEAQVNNDTAKVFDNHQKFLKAREETLKADLLKQTPRPNPNDPINGEITKEQFSKMSLSERTELYQTNPELYKQLQGGN